MRHAIGLLMAGLLTAAVPVPAAADDGLIGLSRAVGVAERTLAARAIEGELETTGGRLVYEIDLVRGATLHRATVDARSGRLLSTIKPRAENWLRGWIDADRLRRGGKAAPLAERLVALERHSGGAVQEVEFAMRKGRGVYEIELATAAGVGHVAIDAATGQRIELAYDD